MIQTAVTSSNIAHLGWEAETLFIKFNNGKSYSYPDVPMNVYNEFVDAPSAGKHFHAEIKAKFVAVPLQHDPFTAA